MELIAYLVMAAGAYYVLVTKRPSSVYWWAVLFVVYSLIVRLSPHTTPDMSIYYQAAQTWPPSLSLYRLREPVLWFGSSLVYQLTGSRVATFLLIDVVGGGIVLYAMKKVDDGDNRMFCFGPTIISSYVLLLGQQNVLRQHLAFAIFLWAIAARSRNQRAGLTLFVLSALTHNATALLFGYWLDVGEGKRRRYGPLVTIAGVILLWLYFPVFRKSSSAIGLNTEYLYLLLAVGLSLLLMYANLGRTFDARSASLLNFFAFAPAIGVLGSAQFERVAMMFLVLILTDVYRHHRSLRLERIGVAHLSFIILVLPVVLFPNALAKLL